ncbi:FtsX-like permease family protein [Nonomuraea sp. NPDC000554]|uniref:FtsX-like permease family protein n=1 Tax=Nonomuraea sp. NPDC000554 TaxID=3154259 RepID=UPI0033322BDC
MSVFLRISRRDALRFRGRSALIMVMIGLPVLVFSALLTGAATWDVSPREGLTSTLGTADALIRTIRERAPVNQDAAGRQYSTYGNESQRQQPPYTAAEINTLLPGRLIPYDEGSVEIHLADGYDEVSALELDLRDPLTRGIRRLVQGRFAATPDEVTITPALVDQGVRLGDTIKVTRRDRPVRVVGVIEHPHKPNQLEAVSLRNVLLLDKNDGAGTGWLADTPAPVQWQDVRRLNDAGLRVSSRAVIENPPAPVHRYADARMLPPIELGAIDSSSAVVGFGIGVLLIVMETVLLAGPAFAVGLRRRRRELAVIAAQGGSPAHLRRIVLADGLVLGGSAALLGAALGVGAALLGAPLAARWLGSLGPPDVPWLQVLCVAVLGLVSGLVAAVVPAVQAARQSPAQVLAGRENEVRDRAGLPVAGAVLLVLGLAATALATRRGSIAILATSVPVVFGLIALTPWLIRVTARLAPRFPLPARLSIRDAARHRVRTASATAAVMAATMGAVAMGIGVTSASAAVEKVARPSAPEGTLVISGNGVDDQGWVRIRQAVEQKLPGLPLTPAMQAYDKTGHTVALEVVLRGPGSDPDYSGPLPIGDERLLALLQGRRDPQAVAALAAGKAVVFDPNLVRDGALVISVLTADDSTPQEYAKFRIPAVVAPGAEPRQRGAVLPAAPVRSAGFTLAQRDLYTLHRDALHRRDEMARFQRDLRAVSKDVYTFLEEKPDDSSISQLWILLGGALILVLGGTFAATGLAAADMRRDLDTLSAVGGPSRTRRLVVAAQAGYIAGLGALVGTVAGVAVGIALTWPMTRMGGFPGESLFDPGSTTIAVPWLFLAGVVLGLPVLAALVAGLFTRTRLVLARRLV